MPANYTVIAAEKVSDKPDRGYGPMQTIRLTLRNAQGADRSGITWYTKASTPVPNPGVVLVGEAKEGQYGWEFKKAQQMGAGGGGRSFQADPAKLEVEREKNRAIASEAAHRVAVDTIRLAIETKQDPAELAKQIVTVGRILFDDTIGRIK